MKRILLLVLALGWLPGPPPRSRQLAAQGWGIVTGRVTDSLDQPIARAMVRLEGTTYATATDARGGFAFRRVPAGTHRVWAALLGYQRHTVEVAVAPNDSAHVMLVLRPAPISLEAVVVTAAKRSQLIEEAVTSVAVVEEADIARRAVNTVDQALERAPGVQFVNGQINIRGTSGFVQGLGNRVLLLVDGVPANQGDRGGINWDLLPVDQVERVEVVKGAGSALYGSSALGGVVNLITREIPTGLHLRVRTTGGLFADPPYDIWRFRDQTGLHGSVDVTASYGTEHARGSLAAGARHSDGYREQDRQDHWQVAGKAAWHPSAITRLNVSGAWASDQYDVPLVWCTRPNCETRGETYQPFKVDTSGLGDRTVSDKGYLAVTLLRTESERFAWQARGSWLRTDFTDYRRVGNEFSVADRFGGEVRAEAHPAESRVVTVGGEVALSDVASNFFGNHTQGEYAAYGEGEQRLGRLRLTTGARIDFLTVDGGSASAVLSPRVGAVLPSRAGVWRASVGRGFRAPSIAERFVHTFVFGLEVIPNPDLEPETAWSVELGNTTSLGRVARFDAALFWTEARDLVEPAVDLAAGRIQLRNVPRARLAGLDFALVAVPLTPRLSTSLAYTYLYARALARASIPEKPLAFRPRHLVTLGADYGYGPFGVGGDFRYMSRLENVELFQDLDLYPGDRRIAAKVLDLRASYQRGPLAIRVLVNNALNYIYNLVPRTLEPVRTVSVTATWTY